MDLAFLFFTFHCFTNCVGPLESVPKDNQTADYSNQLVCFCLLQAIEYLPRGPQDPNPILDLNLTCRFKLSFEAT